MSEAKMIADEIDVVSDKELATYESTGRKMKAPASAAKVYRKKVASTGTASSSVASASAMPVPALAKPLVKLPELYVHIKDPSNTHSLLEFKKICSAHPGQCDVIMVLGADKSKAIRMPFRVEQDDNLIGKLVKVLGEDCVSVK